MLPWLAVRGSQTPLTILLVSLIVALEPRHPPIAFEGQNVRCDPIEKPTVMADNDGAACEVEQRLFKGTQSIYVEVISWLVE